MDNPSGAFNKKLAIQLLVPCWEKVGLETLEGAWEICDEETDAEVDLDLQRYPFLEQFVAKP